MNDTAEGYYVDGECTPYIYNYSPFTNYYGYETNGYRHDKISDNLYDIHLLIEFPAVEEEMCNVFSFPLVPDISFVDGICKYELFVSYQIESISNSQLYTIDGDSNIGDSNIIYDYSISSSENLTTMRELSIDCCFLNNTLDCLHHHNAEENCNNQGGFFSSKCVQNFYTRINDSEF